MGPMSAAISSRRSACQQSSAARSHRLTMCVVADRMVPWLSSAMDVATAFWRRRPRHRNVACHRAHPIHDHRCDASRVLRCGGRTDLRRRSPTQRGAVDPRQGLGPRRRILLALLHGPLEARTVGGGGDQPSTLGAATDSRGRFLNTAASGRQFRSKIPSKIHLRSCPRPWAHRNCVDDTSSPSSQPWSSSGWSS